MIDVSAQYETALAYSKLDYPVEFHAHSSKKQCTPDSNEKRHDKCWTTVKLDQLG